MGLFPSLLIGGIVLWVAGNGWRLAHHDTVWHRGLGTLTGAIVVIVGDWLGVDEVKVAGWATTVVFFAALLEASAAARERVPFS